MRSSVTRVRHRATRLGERCEQQVGADRHLRRHAEGKREQRRHQGAATDTGRSNDESNQCTAQNKMQVHTRLCKENLLVRSVEIPAHRRRTDASCLYRGTL
jgi:hypothetical protein